MSPPTHKLGASKNMGAIFLRKKSARGNVPTSWGLPKILVPKKNGEPERRSLSVCRGARGAAGPPPGGLGGWKPPRKSRGSGGRQPPSKNNLMVLFYGETHTPPSRTRFSNGLAYNRSKVSVKKSQIGFVVINFSRSIFPYMSNIYENG